MKALCLHLKVLRAGAAAVGALPKISERPSIMHIRTGLDWDER